MTWKLSALGSKHAIETALARSEDEHAWDAEVPISGQEIDEAAQVWALECWCEQQPSAALKKAMAALFDAPAPAIIAEELPETDWVTESQKGTPPIHSGRFYVHTPEHPASTDPALTSFCIPAAQAFGTGQHETTAGCLAMLDQMQSAGINARNIIDVGTGTGLLAFAAGTLWPEALLTATDIDPVCAPAVAGNMAMNAIASGDGPGQLTFLIADGLADPTLTQRAPYDLIIANILAAPLIATAGDFARALGPQGAVVLAGLLNTQADDVISAYRAEGLHLHARMVKGDWTILWLRQQS